VDSATIGDIKTHFNGREVIISDDDENAISGLYLECSGRGRCNGRAGGLGDGSPPVGSRGRAAVRVWGRGRSPQKL